MSIDFSSEDVHDEVDLILNCNGEEIMELVATDPGHYLEIIKGYTKTRDGRDIFLPDLCNIIETRNDNEFRIRFKTSDNGNWYEVGFSGGEFTDNDVYVAFSKKVAYALSRPKDQHRAMLLDTLMPSASGGELPGACEEPAASIFSDPVMTEPVQNGPAAMVSQGDQTKLSKIDRFMGRASASTVKEQTTIPVPVPVPVSAPEAKESGIRYEIKDTAVPEQTVDSDNDMVIRYDIKSTESRSTSGVLSELDMLKTICPDDRKDAYARMVSLLRSTDPFYETTIGLLSRLTPGQRCLVIDFLQN